MGGFLSGWLPVALSEGFVNGFCCFIITVNEIAEKLRQLVLHDPRARGF